MNAMDKAFAYWDSRISTQDDNRYAFQSGWQAAIEHIKANNREGFTYVLKDTDKRENLTVEDAKRIMLEAIPVYSIPEDV